MSACGRLAHRGRRLAGYQSGTTSKAPSSQARMVHPGTGRLVIAGLSLSHDVPGTRLGAVGSSEALAHFHEQEHEHEERPNPIYTTLRSPSTWPLTSTARDVLARAASSPASCHCRTWRARGGRDISRGIRPMVPHSRRHSISSCMPHCPPDAEAGADGPATLGAQPRWALSHLCHAPMTVRGARPDGRSSVLDCQSL